MPSGNTELSAKTAPTRSLAVTEQRAWAGPKTAPTRSLAVGRRPSSGEKGKSVVPVKTAPTPASPLVTLPASAALNFFKMQELETEVTSIQNEIELKDNEICDLKNQITAVKEQERHYLHEIEVLESNECCEGNKLSKTIKQLEEEYLNLMKQSDLELLKQDKEINVLQYKLQLFSEESNQSNNSDIDNKEIFNENLLLEKDIETLGDKLLEKQLYWEQLQKQNLQLHELLKNSQVELDQFNENISCKKQSLTEACDLISTVEEEMFSLKHELDTLKGKHQSYSDGKDSLFAEVNNKRLKLQETLLDLTQKCDKIKLEITNKQKQIYALRLDNDELRNIVKIDQTEYKSDQKILIQTYNSRIAALKNLSEQYKNIIAEIQQLSGIGLPKNIVEFLNNLIEEKKKNEERLKEEIGMEFRMQKIRLLQLKESYLKLQEWKDKTEQLKKKYLEHHEAIQKLKQNKDSKCSLGSYKCNMSEQKKVINPSAEDNENAQNLQPNLNTEEAASKTKEKKVVTFSEDTTSSGDHRVRKGGRVIHSKPIHIASLKNTSK
ncbi:hypothetical protein ILUMI_04816 [Ignelater luminosus]|uniref:Uncharacterized protein n=1 Tax=Ignelater luminosus TaxID=2038154 RepID=A0A8K0D8F3_IGNLU|nr:hypothetical protein ILUMI_04816 [Ignelater luminosus]